MTTTPARRDRQEPAQGLLCARGGRHRRRLRRHLRPHRRALFPEIRRPVGRAGAASPPRTTGTASAILMRRCARTSASSSAAARARRIPSSPGRSSAPTARWCRTAPRRSCWPMPRPRAALGKAVAFRAAAHVQDFLPMSKRDILKFEGCALAWQRALGDAGLTLGDLSLVETHDCFTIAELIEYEAMGLAPEGRGASVVKDGLTADRRPAAGQSVGRAQVQGPSDRRDRRVDARAVRDAAHRHGRRFPGEGCAARRPVQHGRRRGRELREHPGADRSSRYASVRSGFFGRRRCFCAALLVGAVFLVADVLRLLVPDDRGRDARPRASFCLAPPRLLRRARLAPPALPPVLELAHQMRVRARDEGEIFVADQARAAGLRA